MCTGQAALPVLAGQVCLSLWRRSVRPVKDDEELPREPGAPWCYKRVWKTTDGWDACLAGICVLPVDILCRHGLAGI